ncbi:MAG: VOC family protein [Cellvibrionales bacterium]|jgi:3,4-dihydroxy-9,10-secoandrosta-1,3,5(10)-triene-9,17-dione 4,5-dioxygenase|nr:VOC family protein [Cellvibrionales bacterium]
MNIRGLGYVGFGAPDPSQWLKFGTEIVGAMPARALPGEAWGMPMDPTSGPASKGSGVGPDGSVYLKIDHRQWRIAIHPSESNAGVLYLGLEVASALDLEQVVAELKAQGIEARMGSAEEAQARSVTGIAYSQDPAGNPIEFFFGATDDYKFVSPKGMHFKTGDLGLGHMNLFVSDLKANTEFYSRVLGFKLSDYIGFGPDMSANFFYCNGRHHTFGITRVGPINGIHHLMLECETVDNVLQCYERALEAGITIKSTLGRHVNDNVLSFYMSSPFGFEVEIGWDGTIVGDDWLPRQFCEGDIWGHKGLDPETIAASAAQIKQK